MLGYLFLSSDVVDSNGYSGRPIQILIGMDLEGKILGVKLLEHHEPIVLIGIPEKRMTRFIHSYVGRDVLARTERDAIPVDAISGATVTVMVIDDSIRRGTIKVTRSLEPGAAAPQAPMRSLDLDLAGTKDWDALLAEGSVSRLHLTVGDVNQAFAAVGDKAAKRPERGPPDAPFIDLYVALVSAPIVGRSLLGEREYRLLRGRLEPGRHAILVGGRGPYSWRGSGYVRGGIFDRIDLIQDVDAVRFRDRDYKRIGDLRTSGAPTLREIGLFTLPAAAELDPGKPWRLQLLAQRDVGALEKAYLTYNLSYELPDDYLEPLPTPTPAAEPVIAAGAGIQANGAPERPAAPLWLRMWRAKAWEIGVLVAGLLVLSAIFFFQDWLVQRPVLTDRVRIGFLLFTLLWIGWYADAQLSVVNVLTLFNALIGDFRWEYFLVDPLIFILWAAVAGALLFWGRGPFCGWLCPFGALQELLNRVAKVLKVPQVQVPWGLHERLWPAKYIIFLGLLGLSIYSLADAERFAEVEPFKTAIILNFVREWPFVTYAVLLLVAGLLIERFFCRYLCPLGAALAIPGRLRMFEWLKRYHECGNPCQRCANECIVQSIHPTGEINPNECHYCLHCQTLYHDDQRCPVMIQKRLRREKREAVKVRDRATSGVVAGNATHRPAQARPSSSERRRT